MALHVNVPKLRNWVISVAITTVLLALIAAAAGGDTWEVSPTILVAVAAVTTLLHRLFPGSRFFTVTFANAIGVYACLYASFLETLYDDVGVPARLTGFLLPILAFALGVFLRRDAIRRIITSEHPRLETRFTRAFVWLVPVVLLGVLNFVVPLGEIGVEGRTGWLLGIMGAVAVVVLLASRNVAVFLIDTGLLFEDFFEIVSGLVKPAFAFLTFYSMIVVLFAAIYALIARFDGDQTFLIDGIARDPSFVESLYFSIVTLSTVGYGDVVPLTYAARIVVAMQIVSGILLLLFGFHALMRQTARGG